MRDERLLTARRQIHRELVLAGPVRQKARKETTFQGFAPFRTHLELYDDRTALAKTLESWCSVSFNLLHSFAAFPPSLPVCLQNPRSEPQTACPGVTCFQHCAASKSRFLHPRRPLFPFRACVLRGTCQSAAPPSLFRGEHV